MKTITLFIFIACFIVNSAFGQITGASTVCAGSTTPLSNATPGGVWTSSNLSVATIGSLTGLVTGVNAGPAIISYNISGSITTWAVSVNPLPAVITGTASVCEGATRLLSSATTGGTWSTGNSSIGTVSLGTVAGVSAGIVNISYQISNGCYRSVPVTVNATPAAITGTSSVCVGYVTALSSTSSGGVWSSYDGSIASVGSSTGAVTGVAALNTTIAYTIGSCAATRVVTVMAVPAAITGTAVVCSGATRLLSSTTTGGTWISGNTTIATVSSGTVSGVSSGIATISYQISNGCYRSVPVTVNATPAAISGTAAVCVGAVTTLSNTVSGGVWSSFDGSIASVGSSTGAVTGVAAMNTTISYTIGTCAATRAVTVMAVPAAITGTAVVCSGATRLLSSSTTGGTWISGNTTIATVSSGTVSGVSSGIAAISYQISNGCYRSVPVTVNATPAAIAGTASVCVGSVTMLSNAVSGGVWSSSDGSIASVGSATGAVTGVWALNATIYYSIGTCAASRVVTVMAVPAAITGTTVVCSGATRLLSSTTTGGTWTSSNTAIATVSSGTVSGVSAGIAAISYQVSNGCYRSVTFTVNATPSAITGTTSVCVGAATALTNTASGGTWSSSNTPVATVGASSGIVSGGGTGTATITYATGCGTVTRAVTVSPLPAAITGTASVCPGATTSLTSTTTGGTWSSSNTGIAVVTSGYVTGIAAGIATISYELSTGCYRTVAVTVNPSPAAITGVDSVCIGATTALANTVSGGVWSSSNTAVAAVNASSGIVTGVSSGTATISYTNGCATATQMVTVAPSIAAITGTFLICQGTTTTLSNTTPGGIWSSSNSAVAYVSAVSGIVYGTGSGVATISYSNGCGTAATQAVSVTTSPSAITGTTTVCEGGTTTLSNATSGGTWSSSNTAVATVSSGTVSGILAGVVTISYRLSISCYSTETVTVNVASAPISGNTSLCVGATTQLANATTGGTWSSNNSGVAAIGSTGSVTAVAAGSAAITYIQPAGCFVTTTVTVSASPSITLGTIAPVCGADTTTSIPFSGATSSPITYVVTWDSAAKAAGLTDPYYTDTVAGTGVWGYSGDGGPATAAEVQFDGASFGGSIIRDASGNIYLADANNWAIRKIDPSGIITTVVGNGTPGYSGDGGAATAAQITAPHQLAVDAAGNLYFADFFNAVVRKVSASGVISTIAGDGCHWCGYTDGAPATSVSISVSGVAIDPLGNVILAGGDRVYRVDTSGIITMIGGGGSCGGNCGDGGPATAAEFASFNGGLAVDRVGNIYVGDNTNNVVRKINTAGIISTVAGNGTGGNSGDGGPATAAQISVAVMTIDNLGNVYTYSNSGPTYGVYDGALRKVDTFGIITTVANLRDLTGGEANIYGIVVDAPDMIYMADRRANIIRKISLAHPLPSSPIPVKIPGAVAAGTYNGDLTIYNGNGCSATYPISVTKSVPAPISGNTKICVGSTAVLSNATSGGTWSSSNSSVATVGSTGIVTMVSAGTAVITYTLAIGCSTAATIAGVDLPTITRGAIASVCSGDTITSLPYTGATGGASAYMLIWDSTARSNGFIDAITDTFRATVIAGTGTPGYSGDGGPATAAAVNFYGAMTVGGGIARDISGNIYFADGTNNVIRKIAPSGIITTVAGNGTWGYSGDGGPATAAQFSLPFQLATNTYGDLYIATAGSGVRKVNSSGIITTIAGSCAGCSYIDGAPATSVDIGITFGVATDHSGNVIISSYDHIYRVDTSGKIWMIGGGGSCGSISCGDGGPATAASFNLYNGAGGGMSIDGAGNIYFVDNAAQSVRKIDTAGIVTTVAGNGTPGYSGDGGPATAASVTALTIAMNNSDDLYIYGSSPSVGYGTIRKVDTSGIITAITDANRLTGGHPNAFGFCVDDNGAFYLADWYNNNFLWKISNDIALPPSTIPIPVPPAVPAGIYSGNVTLSNGHCTDTYPVRVTVKSAPTAITGTFTICQGTTTTFSNGGFGGTWSSSNTTVASVDTATGTATGVSAGTATITYTNGCGSAATQVVTVIPAPGTISGTASICQSTTTTLSNTTSGGTWSSSNTAVATVGATSGIVSGAGVGTATISYSTGCSSAATQVVSVNAMPGSIGTIIVPGNIELVAGTGTYGASGDGGPATAATLSYPYSAVTDSAGNIYISDVYRIRKVSTSGIITTVAGNGTFGASGDGGAATAAQVDPQDIAVDASGNVFLADYNAKTIRKINVMTGIITRVAGTTGFGGSTGDGGAATAATLTGPIGVAFDLSGNLLIADGNSARLRKIDMSTGIISTIAGTGVSSSTGNGGPATAATFKEVFRVSVDAVGNIYICDPSGENVRKIDVTGVVSLVAGNGSIGFGGDGGPATAATLFSPRSAIADAAGNVYIADAGNWRVRRVSASGIITTIAGNGTLSDSGDGAPASTCTVGPVKLSFDASGNILVSSPNGRKIRIIMMSTNRKSVCAGSTITLSNATPGGTWSASNSNATIGSSTGIVTGVTAGTTDVTYTMPGGCFATTTVTINALPATITGATSVCAAATTTLSNTTTGGAWSSSNTAIAIIGTSGTVTGVTAGTATITYQLTTTGCYNTASVLVNSAPGTIAGTTSLCQGATAILSNSIAGGTWSSSNSAVATAGTSSGIVTGIGGGTATITYSNGCGTAATQVVTIIPVPAAISGSASVCAGLTTSLTNSVTGGTWASGNTAVATIGTSGIVTGMTGGTAVITYSNGCGSGATQVVTVSAGPAAITGTASVCATATTALSSATTGGTWSSSNTASATIGTTGVVTGISAGTAVITYALTTGCTATVVITVNPLPAAITGSLVACEGITTSLSSATTGGTWTSRNTAIAMVDASTGVATGLSPGFTTISYTLPTGCLRTAIITVDDVPNAGTLSGSSSVSVGSSIFVTVTVPGGTLSSSDPSVATVSPTGRVVGMSTGTVTITYIVTNGCGSDTATKNITVTPGLGRPQGSTGTATLAQEWNVSVLPNPNTGEFTIKGDLHIGENKALALSIFDVLGQKVYSSNIATSLGKFSETISLRDTLANGIYLLYLSEGGNSKVFRLVVSR